MATLFEGGCHCRAIRYTCTAEPAVSAHCHCTDCQQTTGSGFATVVFVPTAALTITGEAQAYTVTGDEGGTVTRHFCATCGSPVYSEASVVPGMTFLKAGSLDDPRGLRPSMQMWTKSKRPWSTLGDDVPGFPGNPPPP